jgi:hypothetical protein
LRQKCPELRTDLEAMELTFLSKMAHHPSRPVESLSNDVDTKRPLATLIL